MAFGDIDFIFILAAFLIISFAVTWFLKKRFNAQTSFHLISLIKTTKPLWVFDVFAKYKRFWTTLADIGLVLGFGAVAVDFLVGRKKSPRVRFFLFIASFFLLAGFFYVFNLLMGESFSQNFLTKNFFPVILFFFGLFGFSGFILLSLVINAHEIIYRYLIGERACPGVAPLIPGVDIPNVPFTVPLYVWIPLFLILIIHEASHGILGRIAKIRFKSTGVLLLGFLPIGAFVEPDDSDVEKKTKHEKLRFFAGGVSANLFAFALILLLVVGLGAGFSSVFGSWEKQVKYASVEGVNIHDVADKVEFCGSVFPSPAFGQIEPGSKVLQVNGSEIRTINELLLSLSVDRFGPKTFLLQKDSQTYERTLTPNDLGQFGIKIEEIENKNYTIPQDFKTYAAAKEFLFGFLGWFFLLNLLIALVNFLPVPFFDGGRMSVILLAPYLGFLNKSEKETEKLITRFFTGITLVLFIINFLPVLF